MVNANTVRIALFEPRIPQNTGNIARTAAAFNFKLDLIEPLGFSLDDKYLKRAGLDYWPYVDITMHNNLEQFLSKNKSSRIVAFSKLSDQLICNFKLCTNDILLFGREDNGLPEVAKSKASKVLRIPMPGSADSSNLNGVRSLNLSVACGIASYKAYTDIQQI
tara:strand:+ start:2191 stop:2679 length:489 start_codon:yes stop_codon:yes gene_type:complete